MVSSYQNSALLSSLAINLYETMSQVKLNIKQHLFFYMEMTSSYLPILQDPIEMLPEHVSDIRFLPCQCTCKVKAPPFQYINGGGISQTEVLRKSNYMNLLLKFQPAANKSESIINIIERLRMLNILIPSVVSCTRISFTVLVGHD